MKYAVDRIESDFIILQDLKTGEIKEIKKSKINFKIKDRDVLIYKNGKFYKDEKEKEKRLKSLEEKFARVKNI